ncbi:MAG: hypothetical protein H6700_11540 [Myxococcales bacterium]|nr:hypothetical protein [Myxococcales bacterium]MCB9532391.1 hypothetical protein [Myxococcales bacterium]
MKKTPLQRVNEEFGSKTALAKKLAAMLEARAEESASEYEERLSRCSNKQLLRLWEAEAAVKAQFGGKAQLVDAIVKARFGRDNADYRAKIAGYASTRLLDLHRQVAG